MGVEVMEQEWTRALIAALVGLLGAALFKVCVPMHGRTEFLRNLALGFVAIVFFLTAYAILG